MWNDELAPCKEGFLNKEWKLGSGYQKYTYHWYVTANLCRATKTNYRCWANNGVFGYYDDLKEVRGFTNIFLSKSNSGYSIKLRSE